MYRPTDAGWLNNFNEIKGSHLIDYGGLLYTQSSQVTWKMWPVSNNISSLLFSGLQDINFLRIIRKIALSQPDIGGAALTFPAHASVRSSVPLSYRRQCIICKCGSDEVGGILKRGRGSCVQNNNNNKRDGLPNAAHQANNIMDLCFAVVLLIFQSSEHTSQATKLLLSIRQRYELANREDERLTRTHRGASALQTELLKSLIMTNAEVSV